MDVNKQTTENSPQETFKPLPHHAAPANDKQTTGLNRLGKKAVYIKLADSVSHTPSITKADY